MNKADVKRHVGRGEGGGENFCWAELSTGKNYFRPAGETTCHEDLRQGVAELVVSAIGPRLLAGEHMVPIVVLGSGAQKTVIREPEGHSQAPSKQALPVCWGVLRG